MDICLLLLIWVEILVKIEVKTYSKKYSQKLIDNAK